MRLTVFEQSAISVRRSLASAENSIDSVQAEGLVAHCGRIGARVLAWQSPNHLRVKQFVGELRAGGVSVEVLPKIEGLSEAAAVRRSLLGMLAVTEDLEVRSSEVVGYLDSSEPFIRALARLYCKRLLDLVRRGLRQEYVGREEELPYIRGKVDWAQQARLILAQRLEFPCRFDDRSEDTELNRALKAALLKAEALLEGSSDSSVVIELLQAFRSVGRTARSHRAVDRLDTDRISREFAPVLVLAKLILGDRSPDLGQSSVGERETYALVWDMNVLFEEYVGRLARRVLQSRGLRVDLQEGASTYLAVESRVRQDAFLLRPDIVVSRVKTPLVIADTKWKRLDVRQANLGISSSDIYQVLAYARRYSVDQVLLIFPHHPALGTPGLKREFVTRGEEPRQIRVGILTVDLSSLAGVPGQLMQAFSEVVEHDAA